MIIMSPARSALNSFKAPNVLQSPQIRPSLYSTNSSPSSDAASTAAAAFLAQFQSQGPLTRTQLLDANQLHLLSLTLNRPKGQPPITYPGGSLTSINGRPHLPPPSTGSPIPPGYHLVYFTPTFLEDELGADGTDASYNPSAPFTRRMWAGGEVSWPRGPDGKPNLLRVGQEVTETTKVLSAEPKVVRKTGEAMIVVGVEKTFANEEGVAVVDRRNWVFREALPHSPPSRPRPLSEASKKKNGAENNDKKGSNSTTPLTTTGTERTDVYKRAFKQTPVTLFRFSALTFNSHKIHYSVPWAQEVEGHKDIVVHGPLNLILMLDFWRDLQHEKELNGSRGHHPDTSSALVLPQSISYRATNPLYAGQDYEMALQEREESGSSVNILDHSGVVSMKADIKG